jgi:hypothetical protein
VGAAIGARAAKGAGRAFRTATAGRQWPCPRARRLPRPAGQAVAGSMPGAAAPA